MDDTYSHISNIYGMNHYEIDKPFQEILEFYAGKRLNLDRLGLYAGKELYEITDYIDKISPPVLKMWGIDGNRIDSVLIDTMERQAIERLIKDFGINKPYFHGNPIIEHYAMGYLVADPGIYCIITLTHQTAYALHKYGNGAFNDYVSGLVGDSDNIMLGATWFTEIQGGSDLGANQTVAESKNNLWYLTGDKYFASNAGLADVSLTSAFHDGNHGAKGLSLFVLPRRNVNGDLNYHVRRLKEKSATKSVPSGEVELNRSEAQMLGDAGRGIYYITEDLMVSRLDNAAAACGIARKAYLEAYYYSMRRKTFGSLLIEHPGIKRDLLDMEVLLEGSIALTFKTIDLFNKSIKSEPPYDDDYNYTRLMTHIVKNITAESSSIITEMATELHGGIGFLSEFPIERWHREALITPIWEGASNIQALDMIEAIQRKEAHIKMLQDFNRMVNEIKDGRDIASSCYSIINESIDRILSMDDMESQFHAKYLMDLIGNSMASILLIYMGNKTGNNDFITAGKLYFRRYVEKKDYDNDALPLSDSLIHIERRERLIKNR
ncbi:MULTISPECIES: acyl-CoA dehydrogenase family protein [unclassified Acidiplasma]|uniref:acyl-CoA dehydrogenase family protein n=1 Tax=unclassified Acidiplasma TaxID=2641301 RepID=UPI0005E063B7|nr:MULTISPECIES: acyl-CoA dehydrogenase family protein [unclassified Acidiplasma]KJE48578.1 acyl-CoA dehydrogenase [Acidiplasma sp. MBA-1]WMT55316.1 MAG: acyl-CoA dehydrogenase family protein [Acidiplasma sp.]